MNASEEAQTAASARPLYHEPARSYRTSLTLFVLLVAGFGADLALGGGTNHLPGWGLAVVLVVGVDALAVHAARSRRSITLTGSELRVGDAVLPRAQIAGVAAEVEVGLPVLGRSAGAGLPRGTAGLTIRVADGRLLVVPTRYPARLTEALVVEVAVPGVRLAEAQDLPLLAEIDDRADMLFRVAGIDLPVIPFPEDAMHDARAVFVSGRPPVAFVRVDEVDGLAHIEALAVIPGRMRRGLGSALLEAACGWARSSGYRAITLITFADVAWNAPFYTARGFVEVEQLTPEIVELRDWEIAMGLDEQGRRIVMRREL